MDRNKNDLSEFGSQLVMSVDGTEMNDTLATELNNIRPRGIILFTPNIESETQLIQFIKDLKSECFPAPFLSVDYEGGVVNRLKAITGDVPSPCSQRNLREFGRESGRLLKRLGFDLNFAPVCDLDYNIKGNGLDLRYLGDSPEGVIQNASDYLEGMESEGVSGCLKHYPGIGMLKPDSHLELSSIDIIDSSDESVFKALSSENRYLMIGHVYIESLSEITTYSSTILERVKLFHKGPVITDDLSMKALPDKENSVKIQKALKAGFDLACVRIW